MKKLVYFLKKGSGKNSILFDPILDFLDLRSDHNPLGKKDLRSDHDLQYSEIELAPISSLLFSVFSQVKMAPAVFSLRKTINIGIIHS